MRCAHFVCPFLVFAITTVLAQSNPVPFINQPLVPTAVAISACGGGGSSSSGGGGTQAGTYNLTVTGTFTSGSTNLTPSLSFTGCDPNTVATGWLHRCKTGSTSIFPAENQTAELEYQRRVPPSDQGA
jgi:hypothetical protein